MDLQAYDNTQQLLIGKYKTKQLHNTELKKNS